MSCFFASSQCLIIHYSEPTSAKHRGIARKRPFPNIVSFRQIVYWLLLQFHCLACALESASRAATLSRAVCFSVSDCVCERCASSCLPSLPLPPCDAFARSWERESMSALEFSYVVRSTEPLVAERGWELLISKPSQPSSEVQACATCASRAPWRIRGYAPRLLWRLLLWVMNRWRLLSSILVSGHLAAPLLMSCFWSTQVLRRLCDLLR